MINPTIFIIIAAIALIINLTLGILSLKNNTSIGHSLGVACFASGLVIVFYTLSIVFTDYMLMSFFSSLYFVSIDVLLISLLVFSVYFTKEKFTQLVYKIIVACVLVYGVFDSIVMMINPFIEIAISYVEQSQIGFFTFYSYKFSFLYELHLAYSYVLVALTLSQFVKKTLQLPHAYRSQYIISVYTILATVLLNVVYLVFQSILNWGSLDFSILLYTFTASLLYWNCFHYSSHGMFLKLSHWVVSNIFQGVLLFDHEKSLLFFSDRMKDFFPGLNFHSGMTFDEFLAQSKLHFNHEALDRGTDISFRYFSEDFIHSVNRCDFKVLKGTKGDTMGYLLSFTEMKEKKDLLTGFTSWDSFKNSVETNDFPLDKFKYTIVCDINNLQKINLDQGRATGDHAIMALSEALVKAFPRSTYFLRGSDAYLFAFTDIENEKQIVDCIKNLDTMLSVHNIADIPYSYSYGIANIDKSEDILTTLNRAIRSMHEKKMLDSRSASISQLNSLIKALQECDGETEQHIQRTRLLGTRLGERIGLTDSEQSDLSLLCLLHDIGKIGIPLEILNKPGKLTNEEWIVLQSHVEKGYQIASSTEPLKDLAPMIRYHHERWDGKGYPDGLSKESIPILSRIISIVDAYDAMTNDRAYRKAISKEKAREEIRRCAGSQFDPGIASEFLQMLETEEQDLTSISDTLTIYPKNDDANEEVLSPRGINAEATSSVIEHTDKYIKPVTYSKYILDKNNYIISIDENFEKITGYGVEDIKDGKLNQLDLIFPSDRNDYDSISQDLLRKYSCAYIEHRIMRKDGKVVFTFCYGKQFFDSATRQAKSEITIMDAKDTLYVSIIYAAERKKAMKRLHSWEEKYRCDSLTGLLTHEAFKNDLETYLIKKKKVLFLMMDLDKFKEYNDTYGHHAGDEYLILYANCVNKALGKNALACRIGGDELAAAIILDENTSDERAYARARRICNNVNLILSSQQGSSTLSMGAVVSDPNDQTFNKLYEAADKALYRAKAKGRSRMVKFTDL